MTAVRLKENAVIQILLIQELIHSARSVLMRLMDMHMCRMFILRMSQWK